MINTPQTTPVKHNYKFPDNFSLDRVLPQHRKYLEPMSALYSLVLTVTYTRGSHEDRSVPLYSPLLQKRLGKDYRRVISLTEHYGLIGHSDSYVAKPDVKGQHFKGEGQSKHYWICEEYRHRKAVTYTNKPAKVNTRPATWQRKRDEARKLEFEAWLKNHPHYAQMLRHLHHFSFDPSVFELFANHEEFSSVWQCLENIINGQWEFEHSKTCNRLFTTITRLDACLRAYLRIDGEPVWSVDVRNSQPSILVLLLQRIGREQSFSSYTSLLSQYPSTNPPIKGLSPMLELTTINWDGYRRELKTLQGWVESGTVYTEFAEIAGIANKPREKQKTAFFTILFAPSSLETAVVQAFRKTFPEIAKALTLMKAADYKDLARMLQVLEGEIMLGGVAKRLCEEYPDIVFTTVHDSILCKHSDLELVSSLINEEYAKQGINVGLKQEACASELDVWNSRIHKHRRWLKNRGLAPASWFAQYRAVKKKFYSKKKTRKTSVWCK